MIHEVAAPVRWMDQQLGKAVVKASIALTQRGYPKSAQCCVCGEAWAIGWIVAFAFLGMQLSSPALKLVEFLLPGIFVPFLWNNRRQFREDQQAEACGALTSRDIPGPAWPRLIDVGVAIIWLLGKHGTPLILGAALTATASSLLSSYLRSAPRYPPPRKQTEQLPVDLARGSTMACVSACVGSSGTGSFDPSSRPSTRRASSARRPSARPAWPRPGRRTTSRGDASTARGATS